MPDSRSRSRPLHYGTRFEIMCVPTTGKPGCVDVLLVERTAKAERFKQAHRFVKAWRGRAKGVAQNEALAEAHKLRDEMDASLLQYKKR